MINFRKQKGFKWCLQIHCGKRTSIIYIKRKCQQSMNIRRTEIMKFVFNVQRNRILEQNSEEGK